MQGKKMICIVIAVLCLLGIGSSVVTASDVKSSNTDTVFKSQPKQVEVSMKEISPEEILNINSEYFDYIEANLGVTAAKQIEKRMLEDWTDRFSNHNKKVIDLVETDIKR